MIYLSLACRMQVLLTHYDSYEASRKIHGSVTNISM